MLTRSEQETISLGQELALKLKGGDIVALHGELGAGKTTLVKGIAAGLGVKDDILSPTFTLMNVYHLTTLPPNHLTTFVHIDTYRLKNEQELIEIGVEDYLGDPKTVCVIEWPEKIQKLLKGMKTTRVTLSHGADNERKIVIRENTFLQKHENT